MTSVEQLEEEYVGLDRETIGFREAFEGAREGLAGDEVDDEALHESVGTDGMEAPAGEETFVASHGDLEDVPGYNRELVEASAESLAARQSEEFVLDAWYAEFGDAVSRAVATQQRSLGTQVAEVVIGQDDRVRINNTSSAPWKRICSLKIRAQNNTNWIGTGWLVGPRTIITAGHCVFMREQGGWARQIEVIPGRNAASRPFGSVKARALRSVKGWTKNGNRNFDYGAIILPASHPYGSQLGYFGFANLSSSSLQGLRVNISGYPGDKPAGTQWWHARGVTQVQSRTLLYNIDTAGGQSGAPVWCFRDGKRHCVGIHTNGSLSGNSATRINSSVFKRIKAWKEEVS